MESVRRSMFGLFRKWPFPTLYPPLPTAVTTDVLVVGTAYGLLCLFISFILILPGVRHRQRRNSAIQLMLGMFILASLLLCNFGQDWEVASLVTRTQYKAGVKGIIRASIKVKIGLRSVNITLTGIPRTVWFGAGIAETIDYNERFSWDNEGWVQGQLGFGPGAGRFNQEYRAGQVRGLPYPILWIAEYLTVDGEGLRWGRFYRQAGYFTHALLWLALPLWLLSLVLLNLVISYGVAFCLLTGSDLLLAATVYSLTRNPVSLVIPFEDGRLEFHWGWCFWLCISAGLLCVFVGCLVMVLDHWNADKVAGFFGKDVCDEAQELYVSTADLRDLERTSSRYPVSKIRSVVRWCGGSTASLGPPSSDDGSSLNDYDDQDTLVANENYHQMFLKRTPSSLLLLKVTNKLRDSFPVLKRKPITHSDSGQCSVITTYTGDDPERFHRRNIYIRPNSSNMGSGSHSNNICFIAPGKMIHPSLSNTVTGWRQSRDKLLVQQDSVTSESDGPLPQQQSCNQQNTDHQLNPDTAATDGTVNEGYAQDGEMKDLDGPQETTGSAPNSDPPDDKNTNVTVSVLKQGRSRPNSGTSCTYQLDPAQVEKVVQQSHCGRQSVSECPVVD